MDGNSKKVGGGRREVGGLSTSPSGNTDVSAYERQAPEASVSNPRPHTVLVVQTTFLTTDFVVYEEEYSLMLLGGKQREPSDLLMAYDVTDDHI